MNISDDKLFFDPTWYREQTLNSPTEGENKMSDHKEKKGSGDIIISESDIAEDKGVAPCSCCCDETECRLPANEWTDD
jgi:hypothetical protein